MYVCGSEFLTMLWRWVYVCVSGQYRDVRDVTEELLSSVTELNSSSVALPVVNGDLVAIVATDTRDGNAHHQHHHC